VFYKDKLWIAVHVDDLVLMGDEKLINDFKEKFGKRVKMKDLGPVKHILGSEVERPNKHSIRVSQVMYIKKVPDNFQMSDVTERSTPCYEMNTNNVRPCNPELYKRAIGCLQYICMCTRPDVSYTVGVFSRFCKNPTMDHWNGIKAMSYLKGTMYAKLVFVGRKDVKAYCDANWANDKGDSRSIGGYVILMSSAAVSWRSKKHNVVATTSTLEAEYIYV
jgi:hypothetical protein